MKTCIMCLEEKENVSRCTLCFEAGISCHECDKKWVLEGNNKIKCSVCKNNTKIDCFIDIIMDNTIDNTIDNTMDNTIDNIMDNIYIYVIYICRLLLVSWAMSGIGYTLYVEIFNVKKFNYWGDLHISFICGIIITCIMRSIYLIYHRWIFNVS